jgi:hypothetical protein
MNEAKMYIDTCYVFWSGTFLKTRFEKEFYGWLIFGNGFRL